MQLHCSGALRLPAVFRQPLCRTPPAGYFSPSPQPVLLSKAVSFTKYYTIAQASGSLRLTKVPTSSIQLSPPAPKMSDALRQAFTAFASYGKGQEIKVDMDNKNFSKCIKDSKIMDAKCMTSTEVDITFMKVKAKTDRTINFVQFCAALDHFAQKKGVRRAELEQKIAAASPQSNATQAAAVKFHDDKSLYTGVHKNGGPTNVDKMRAGGLAGLCDRSPADNRGVKYVH